MAGSGALRRVVQESQRGQHARARLRARDVAAFHADGVGVEREADGRDAREGRRGQRSGTRPVSPSVVSQKKLKVRFSTSSNSGSSGLTGTTGVARTTTGCDRLFFGGVSQRDQRQRAGAATSGPRRRHARAHHAATGALQQRVDELLVRRAWRPRSSR